MGTAVVFLNFFLKHDLFIAFIFKHDIFKDSQIGPINNFRDMAKLSLKISPFLRICTLYLIRTTVLHNSCGKNGRLQEKKQNYDNSCL